MILSNEPEVFVHKISAGDFLFLSTDGIFDVMSDKKIKELIIDNYDNDEVLINLFDIAKRNYEADDNLTAILLQFSLLI